MVTQCCPTFGFSSAQRWRPRCSASSALGLATTVRLSHQVKIRPLEASRSLAYAERTDWNRPADPN